jgi:hypothetical protein
MMALDVANPWACFDELKIALMISYNYRIA